MPLTRPLELDNPIWHALKGLHRRFAEVSGDTCWYPSAIAPFIAVPHAGVVRASLPFARIGRRESNRHA